MSLFSSDLISVFLYLMLKKSMEVLKVFTPGGLSAESSRYGRMCAMELPLPSDLTSTLILLQLFSCHWKPDGLTH